MQLVYVIERVGCSKPEVQEKFRLIFSVQISLFSPPLLNKLDATLRHVPLSVHTYNPRMPLKWHVVKAVVMLRTT